MSYASKILESSLLLILANWLKRLLGIVSIVILARLLTPEDYGVVAVAMLFMSFLQLFAQTGIEQYVLSRSDISKLELDSAWSLALASKLVIAVSLLASSEIVANFFGAPEVANVLRVLAIVPVLNGLASPSVFILSRNLEYKKIAYITVCAKILAFGITVTAAIVLESYWALILGDIALSISFLVGTYLIHSYRPRWSSEHWRRQWGFSKWIYLGGLFGFCRAKADIFIVGKIFDSSLLGSYTLSKEVALLPEELISRPLAGVVISGINEYKSDLVRTARNFEILVGLMVSLILPAAVGIYLIAPVLVPVALGDKWSAAVPLLQGLAALSFSYAIADAVRRTLIALELVKEVFVLDVVTFFSTVLGLLYAIDYGITVFAWARSATGIIVFVITSVYLSRRIPISFTKIMLAVVPAVGCSLFMAVFVHSIANSDCIPDPVQQLAALVLTGAGSYSLMFVIGSVCLSNLSPTHNFIFTTIRNWTLIVLKCFVRPRGA